MTAWTSDHCRPAATVSFVGSTNGEWGIEIAGGAAPRIQQPKPARLEIFNSEQDIRPLAAGYKTVEKSAAGMDARAEIAYGGNVVFHVQDRWSADRSGGIREPEGGSHGKRAGRF